MSELTLNEFEKLHDELVNVIVRYSDHLISDGIKSNTLSLTNGFNVTFRDRKRKRVLKKEKD